MADKKQASEISGVEKAAVLLMSLGEQNAAEVFKYIGPKEVHRLSSAMANLSKVSTEQANTVLKEFVQSVGHETSFGMAAQDYLQTVLVKALGQDKAGNIINRVMLGGADSGLDQLKWMDSHEIYEVIKMEHPQIIAVVLSYLDNDQAAEVLTLLSEKVRADVLLRIAVLDRLQPTALQELNQVIEEQFRGNSNVKSSTVGGIKVAANILNSMESALETTIMDQINEFDKELGDKIQDLMFVFDDLSALDDRGIQSLLREVSSETLVIALKGAEEALKEKVFKNMSKRAGEMLRDDLEAKGPVRLSEVEVAQKEILAIARRLSESGDISLGGKGGEEYV
ncbi:MAG: flagellar motor switch protein FliG [Gammaproteobacteria bacterium]|nr:flagellar motor switch protein FliG [Gammaproteobacteria bacterium]